MTGKDKILSKIKDNQPALLPLPDLSSFEGNGTDILERFMNAVSATGGKAVLVDGYEDIAEFILKQYGNARRIITYIPELKGTLKGEPSADADAHLLADVDLAVLQVLFGVAENGAVWITEEQMQERALPFITQDLAVVLSEKDLLPTMHEAYQRIGGAEYGFATFIAGPSKTADIEQSLVLGAHGPCSLVVFIVRTARL